MWNSPSRSAASCAEAKGSQGQPEHVANLVEAVRNSGHKDVTYIGKREDIAKQLHKELRAGDIFITLGAGDIQLTCNDLIELLEKDRGEVKNKNLAVR